ncbi:hypothetical protein ACFYTQ_29310 [Nocardia sp. NPDC004068]|uniref:hypothetical protein n=1 Tax=Nocardia sp. NPDC004068 TaxID=3364303 RepID=UPI0036A4C0B7
MTTDHALGLPDAFRDGLGPNWSYRHDGNRLHIRYRQTIGTFRPPRRSPEWPELLTAIESSFAARGVHRAPPLPLRWGRETDFTISAVQALDPYLKHCKPFVFREGFLPQPVVRFTGERSPDGQLADGFLTSFVNLSHVRRITDLHEHARILDDWIGVLSDLGLHAGHLTMQANLDVWQRRQVKGITLHIAHDGMPLGDCVLLWNAKDPRHMVTDLGSGLERIHWALTRRDWRKLVHGSLSEHEPNTLDALRTATLALGSGIPLASRGCGGAIRRLLGGIPREATPFGVSRAVRAAHGFWSLVAPLPLPWYEVVRLIEDAIP